MNNIKKIMINFSVNSPLKKKAMNVRVIKLKIIKVIFIYKTNSDYQVNQLIFYSSNLTRLSQQSKQTTK